MGLEPMTSSLPRTRSTTELQQLDLEGWVCAGFASWSGEVCQENRAVVVAGKAGEGNRTLVFSLEGYCSTIELHPRSATRPVRGNDRRGLNRPRSARLAGGNGGKWGVQDSNLRRQCHQIYSLTPLTARETPLRVVCYPCSPRRSCWPGRPSLVAGVGRPRHHAVLLWKVCLSVVCLPVVFAVDQSRAWAPARFAAANRRGCCGQHPPRPFVGRHPAAS